MPIETLDPKNSILFLGSGFSAGAFNIANEKLPAGESLLARLAEAIDENPNDHDLKSVADEFSHRFDTSLHEILYNTFTVSSVLDYQREIISLPWARIYTTNYDDMVSLVKGGTFPIFAFDEEKPRSLPPSFAVYLHGSIRKATEDNSERQLILNSHSYDMITRDHPTWFYEFQRDRRTFDACYFMGFSLGDHHITGLMASGETSARHTHFITRNPPKKQLADRVPPYGEIVPIGFDGFAALAKKLPPPSKPGDPRSLQSFKLLKQGIDAKPLVDPTPIEIINLVTFGNFSQSRFFNTTSDDSYVTRRSKSVESALAFLQTSKTVLIHSRLGNGKTIFTSILARAASEEGYKCYLWRRAGKRLAQDLDVIREEGRALIIFDDYDAAVDNIERVSAGVPNAKFAVTIRSGQQDVRRHEVLNKLPEPIKRINLDFFADDDKNQLRDLLDRAGARKEGFDDIFTKARDIREIVMQLYDHALIREKIRGSIGQTSGPLVMILALASLIKWAGVELDDSDLQELADCDIYAELEKSGSLGADFLSGTDDRVEMRSALLSEYLIQKILPPKQILDACYTITTTSTRRRHERVHRALASVLMKDSTLKHLLKFHPGVDQFLHKHYARLSDDKAVNDEPLFWLQYAIFMKRIGDISKARLFLNTGYKRASDIAGFKTFQLDTQALSIYLLEEIVSTSSTVEGIEHILASIELVSDMISEESHRQYAIEVIGEIPAFIDVRQHALGDAEKVALIFQLNRASGTLKGLPLDEKVRSGSEIVRTKLEEAIAKLLTVKS
ncbi:SIR2 family protein [Sphingomonas sp. PR090111-T3T-6A]|uniref:SIR2 family protein n=1 Tax=Sphingomonas sp. PR090111-T3T-6A TaxID=685778 RepID=UPI0003A67B66|nr:SIR2 family protein [Sphingomonas sp. PR090111-T3T-6A]